MGDYIGDYDGVLKGDSRSLNLAPVSFHYCLFKYMLLMPSLPWNDHRLPTRCADHAYGIFPRSMAP